MEIIQGSTYYLEILITDTNGNGITGLSVGYEIFESSTNNSVDTGTLTDVGGGIYRSSYTFSNLGQFLIVYNAPTGYSDEQETIFVVENKISELEALIRRILGLSQENYRLVDYVYDGNGQLTNAKIKLFNSAADCENNVSAFAEYEIAASYDINGKIQSYKVKRTL